MVVLRILGTLAVLAFVLALHYTFWRFIVVETGAPRWLRRTVAGLQGALALCVPGAIAAMRRGWADLATGLAWAGMVALALVGLTVLVLLVIVVPRWAWRKRSRPAAAEAPPQPARRQFLARLTGASASLASSAAVAKGMHTALRGPDVVRVSFALPGLPAALQGLRIVQITDLHIGLTIDRAYVEDVVAKTNALKPDVIVLTGDLVDGTVEALAYHAAPLAKLQSTYGAFGVTGNHEYYSGAEAWIVHFATLGIRFLHNAHVAIGTAEASFDLAGVPDFAAFREGRGPKLDAALAGRDPSRGLVLLAHQPRFARHAAQRDVPLVLSGHTHGGQIWPWHFFVLLQQRGLLAGTYQIGQTTLYVSRGTGYWGPPVRLGAPPELTEITLRCPA